MDKILLLGGSSQQVIAIETAKRLGLYTILCDYLPDNPGQHYSDKFYQESTTDKEAILRIAQQEKIDYIIAYASDPAAPTAAYVAEKMGLPTNPYSAVNTLCNKDMFRIFLKKNGFCTPRAVGYNDKKKAYADIINFSFPIIIKPVDSSGSKGVTVLKALDSFEEAIDTAFSFSRSHCIIIEEYIEKKHPYLIGGDIFVSKGQIIQWGLMNCHRDASVNPLVPVGKSYPPIISESDMENVKCTLQKLVSLLKIKFGPMNVELVIDKDDRAFLIDVGPRSGGNMIPDLLGLIFGCDMVEMSIRAAMGQTIRPIMKVGEPYYATLNIHCDRFGLLKRIEFSKEIEQYIVFKKIYKKQGDEIHYFSNASETLGIVFFKFPSMQCMIEMEKNMNEHVKIVLQGEN
ncbi:ATP-grasp domain-containing protein [Clostridiales bacterium]|nr:ATP-grasp domain-containing protein [Clostridiales bacterium]